MWLKNYFGGMSRLSVEEVDFCACSGPLEARETAEKTVSERASAARCHEQVETSAQQHSGGC